MRVKKQLKLEWTGRPLVAYFGSVVQDDKFTGNIATLAEVRFLVHTLQHALQHILQYILVHALQHTLQHILQNTLQRTLQLTLQHTKDLH